MSLFQSLHIAFLIASKLFVSACTLNMFVALNNLIPFLLYGVVLNGSPLLKYYGIVYFLLK